MYLDQKSRKILNLARCCDQKKDLSRLIALIANYGPLESIEVAKERFLEKTQLKVEALRSFCSKASHLESHWKLLESNPGLKRFEEISVHNYFFLNPQPANFFFLQELCAIEHYQELKCQHSFGPMLAGLGRCRVGQKRLILMALGREKGQSIEHKLLPNGVKALAKALAELHSLKPQKKAFNDEKEIAKEKKFLAKYYQFLMKSLAFEQSVRLQRAFERTFENAETCTYRSGPSIQGLELSEIYHCQQKIYFMNLSQARLEEGFPPQDYCRVIWQLQSDARDDFEKHYSEFGGQIPKHEQQMRLFTCFLIQDLHKAFFQGKDTKILLDHFDDLHKE